MMQPRAETGRIFMICNKAAERRRGNHAAKNALILSEMS
jgi:hypothetical protein